MSPTELSYDELKQEFSQQIRKAEHGVLATSDGNYVTAREMMLLSDDLKFMCFTGENSRKYRQMQSNNKVALSINNLQIEGTANLTGHPSNDENAGFREMFKERYPEVYEFWGPICENPDSDARVIEINPTRIAAYKASVTGTHLDVLNVVTETATRLDLEELSQTNYHQY